MQVDIREFVEFLSARGIDSYYGVPDSLLKGLSAFLERTESGARSLVCANEGAAIGMAIGDFVSSGKAACVYMQNSGIGNALNPLVSLAAKEVYSVPILLLVGWRGEPNVPDEPQHALQGKITEMLLEDIDVPHVVLDFQGWEEQLKELIGKMNHDQAPVAAIVRKGFFGPVDSAKPLLDDADFQREELLDAFIRSIDQDDIVVSTTGKCSRELFELREIHGLLHDRDLLVVGGMGHASSIAFGIAQNLEAQDVWCLDGDGALLMHAGSLVVIAQNCPPSLKYVVNQNGVHESVGGQKNAAMGLDLHRYLCACGFDEVLVARNPAEVQLCVSQMEGSDRKMALVLRSVSGARSDLGRPTIVPRDNLRDVMTAIRG